MKYKNDLSEVKETICPSGLPESSDDKEQKCFLTKSI